MEYILPVVCSLSLIVLVFLYIFIFRVPSAQINAQMAARLQELYADTRPTHERSTLLLRSREPVSGQLMALVVWLEGYETIDTTRQILPTAFNDYYEGVSHRLWWRETWSQADYDLVKRSSTTAFEQKRTDLQAEGWQVVFDLAFSPIDAIVFLERKQS